MEKHDHQRLHAARTREGVRDGEHARAAVVHAGRGINLPWRERTLDTTGRHHHRNKEECITLTPLSPSSSHTGTQQSDETSSDSSTSGTENTTTTRKASWTGMSSYGDNVRRSRSCRGGQNGTENAAGWNDDGWEGRDVRVCYHIREPTVLSRVHCRPAAES